jgi:hypothetical protein
MALGLAAASSSSAAKLSRAGREKSGETTRRINDGQQLLFPKRPRAAQS